MSKIQDGGLERETVQNRPSISTSVQKKSNMFIVSAILQGSRPWRTDRQTDQQRNTMNRQFWL